MGIDVVVPSFDGVDAIITQITGIGQPDPSPSRTPSPSASRSPQPSDSRTPAPSASRTPAPSASPSRTPSPSGPCVRFCECPSFTCALIYDDQFSNNDVDLGSNLEMRSLTTPMRRLSISLLRIPYPFLLLPCPLLPCPLLPCPLLRYPPSLYLPLLSLPLLWA